MKNRFSFSSFFRRLFSSSPKDGFSVVVLGCSGGPVESNVSGYLVAQHGSQNFIALDAGSLLGGILLAHKQNSFSEISADPSSPYGFEGQILRDHIKAYLISHAHLDHMAGLVLNAPADTKKPIFGLSSTIDYIRDYLFNGKIWPNFGSEGNEPCLHQYHYQRLQPHEQVAIADTGMAVKPFVLSHPEGYPSTAFLISAAGNSLAYLGDTAPDAVGSQKNLEALWIALAPLIQQKKLRALFVECSYAQRDPDHQSEGHLDPAFLMQELRTLSALVNPARPKKGLKNFNVVVTHIKDPFIRGSIAQDMVRQALAKQDDLGIHWIFPKQGQKLLF